MKLTRNDLIQLYYLYNHCKIGYCCYQKDGKQRTELIEVGYNSGSCGCNWKLFVDTETDTLYVSSYRNVPSCIKEK